MFTRFHEQSHEYHGSLAKFTLLCNRSEVFTWFLEQTKNQIYFLQEKLISLLSCKYYFTPKKKHDANQGAQWLNGRVLDSGPRGCWLEPHRRHCVVVLEQDTFILA